MPPSICAGVIEHSFTSAVITKVTAASRPTSPGLFDTCPQRSVIYKDLCRNAKASITMTTLNKPRPVHLNLAKIRLPIGGIMSIIHRITGVAMFLAVPFLIYLLDLSLISEQGYREAGEILHSFIGTVLLFGLMWGLMHHLLAGIRYLLIDVDLGVEKAQARQSALAVTVVAPVLGLLLTWGLL